MSGGAKSVGVQTYARVRIFFKGRESMELAVQVKTAEQTPNGKGLLTVLSSENDNTKVLKTEFTDCFPGAVSNEYCYEKVCVPMIKQTLKGFKALLIAYGQTGSGKTFSLIGAKGPGQLGLLPRTIKHFVDDDSVLAIKMKGFEAYSTTLTKIPLFDLFNPVNVFTFEPFVEVGDDKAANKAAEYKWVQRKSAAAKALWGSKKGRTGINTMKEGNFEMINNVDDGFRLVDFAHDNSHFAKTGKNPESSRGHTVYVLILKIKNPQGEDYDPVQTEFVVVDLAGSEGGSTLDALPDGPDKTARFLEGGVINFGLTSLKDMFAEMRKKGKLKASEGNGLRKLLYPFVTSNTMMSIVFTLSPSMSNIMATRATMKFAADACKLKMKPVADTGKKNWEKLYKKLEAQLIEKNNLIKELQEHMNDGADIAQSMSGSSGGGAASGELHDKFVRMFEAHADRLYGAVQEFGIDSCLSDDIMETVQTALSGKKEDYIERLKGVYEKYEPDFDTSKIPAMVETQISKGTGLQNYYEIISDQFDHAAEGEIRRATLLTPQQAQESKGTQLWMKKAEILREKTANLASMHDDNIAKMKMELEQVQEEEDDAAQISMEDYGELLDFGDDEEHDFSAPPKWFIEFDETTQLETEEKIKNALDDTGKLSDDIIQQIMSDLNIDATQMDDLRTYVLIAKGNEHDANTIQVFQEELGATGADAHVVANMSSDELNQILELKTQIHKLENEKRVERTMKLWGNMRLRIRDRKLKAREQQVKDLDMEKTQLSRHLSERTFALEEKKKEIQRAADELSHMKTAFDVLKRQDHETMQAMSSSLSEEKKTLQDIKEKLMKEHEELKTANDQLTKEMGEMREAKAKLEGELEIAQRAMDNNQQVEELKEIERVLAEVRKESKSSVGEVSKLLNEMREELVAKYQERLEALQREKLEAETDVQKSKNQLMDLEYEVKAKDAKINELENSGQTMEGIREEYKGMTEELKKAKESVEEELNKTKEEASALQKELNSTQSELRAMEEAQKSRQERAEKRSLDANASQEDLHHQIDSLREQKQKLMSEHGELRQQLGLAQGQLESKQTLLDDLQTRYKKAMDENHSLQDDVKEMNTLRNAAYARDNELNQRNQQIAKLEDKLENLEDELGESRRRESTASMQPAQNFDQLKSMIEKTMEKMNSSDDILEKMEEVMKGSDMSQKYEEALREKGDLQEELGKLRGEMMIKESRLEEMDHLREELSSRSAPQERSSGGLDDRAAELLKQNISNLEQQLDRAKDKLEKEKSEHNMAKGRLDEMQQSKAAIEAHVKTLQEQLSNRGMDPVSNTGASSVELERALSNLEETKIKYHQSLEELGTVKGTLAMKDALLEDMKSRQQTQGVSGGDDLASQIDQLRRDLLDNRQSEDVQHKVFQLENEVRTLQATVDIKDREMADLRREMEEKRGPSNIEVQRELSDKDTQIGHLEDKLLRLSRDLERKDERFNELQDTLAAFDHREEPSNMYREEQMQNENMELRRQLQDLQDENSRLNRDLESSYTMNTNIGQIDELRNTAAAALAKQNALEAAIAAKDDEIQRANAQIAQLRIEISGLQNQINYERKKMAEVDKQREERLQNLIEYQCQAIRNQLSAMADSAGLNVTPSFLEPLQRDIKKMSSILSQSQRNRVTNSTSTTRIINGGGAHKVQMQDVDYGKVIADQIAQQRARCRELEDQLALKNAKINQLQNSMENMKVLHQKEMDEQELAYLLEMRKMREIVRKLRQLSPKVRRLPEIVDLGGTTSPPAGSGLGGYNTKSNLTPTGGPPSRHPYRSKHESSFPRESTDSSRYKTSRSRDRIA